MPMPPKIKVNQIFTSNNYGNFKIIEYLDKNRVKIRSETTGYERWTSTECINKGQVRDPYFPRVQGVGFEGEGKYAPSKNKREYSVWTAMLRRCYKGDISHPTYKEVTVCKRWHNFQNFCKDIRRMPFYKKENYYLDKDLIKWGNKIYDPKYCSFVPPQINGLMGGPKLKRKLPTGVHKHEGNSYYYISIYNNHKKVLYHGFSSVKTAHKYYCQLKIKMIKRTIKKYKNVLDKRILKNLKSLSYKDIYEF